MANRTTVIKGTPVTTTEREPAEYWVNFYLPTKSGKRIKLGDFGTPITGAAKYKSIIQLFDEDTSPNREEAIRKFLAKLIIEVNPGTANTAADGSDDVEF